MNKSNTLKQEVLAFGKPEKNRKKQEKFAEIPSEKGILSLREDSFFPDPNKKECIFQNFGSGAINRTATEPPRERQSVIENDNGDIEKRIAQIEAGLKVSCEKLGIMLSADGRVTSREAARLLNVAEGSLRNWRQEGCGPNFLRRPLSGCRISYRIADLARWLETGTNDYGRAA